MSFMGMSGEMSGTLDSRGGRSDLSVGLYLGAAPIVTLKGSQVRLRCEASGGVEATCNGKVVGRFLVKNGQLELARCEEGWEQKGLLDFMRRSAAISPNYPTGALPMTKGLSPYATSGGR